MPEPIEPPNPAELQLYPRATMSERAAEAILPPEKAQRVSPGKLARAAAFHRDTALQRQDNAAARAALRRAHEAVDKADRQAARDAQSYLIHESKASTCPGCGAEPAYDSTFDGVSERIERMASAKAWSLAMSLWLDDQRWLPHLAEDAYHKADKLRTCGSYLVFRELIGLDENRLAQANFCQMPKLCPLCAMRKAAKEVQAHAPAVLQVMRELGVMPYMLTVTVRSGRHLAERLEHLTSAWRRLLAHRRKVKSRSSRNRGGEVSRLEGGRYSIEIKRGSGSGGWHPHLHAVVLAHSQPDAEALSAEWKRVTGDSFIVDARPMHCHEQAASCADPREAVELLAGDLVEVLKYPLKFGSMSHADTWEAFQVTSGKTLASSFGCLRGVEVDEGYLDEPFTSDDWSFVEVVARWMFGGYEIERGDDWTHNDDADAYFRDRAVKKQGGRFSEAKALPAGGDNNQLVAGVQASPQTQGGT